MRMNVTMLSFILTALSGVIVWGQTNQNLEGIWMGKLKIPSGPLFKIVIDVEHKPDDSPVSHLISLDQGCISMAFHNTTLENGKVCWEMESPPITITGKYDRNSQTVIEGQFQQGGGTFPLKVLADYLTRHGIAVLRVDDRGVGSTTGNFGKSTTRDFADDVLAGVQYLRNRKDIRPDGIGLIGHSEGGMIAPMAAAESSDVSFVVLMAAPGIPVTEVMYLQHRQGILAEGQSEAKANMKCDLYQRLYGVVKQEKDDQAAIGKMMQTYSALSSVEKKLLGWDEGKASSEIHDLVSPWKRYFINFDPQSYLHKVKCPLLAINGKKDCQVIS